MLYEVARIHGSLISLNDLVHLMPEHVSEYEIEDAIRSHPELSSRFALESGYVIEKGTGPDDLVSAERLNRVRASVNLRQAARFVPLLKSAQFSMVGVSGSTSYRSASMSRDLDLFCVAPADTMWISLTKALLLSRGFSLARRDAPPICLSCVMDEAYAHRIFSSDQGGLFARDALQTVVLIGEPAYKSIMSRARWISKIYPAAFSRWSSPASGAPPVQRRSAWAKAINRLLYVLAGSYIGVKSSVLNRRLAAKGRSDSVFSLRKGEDHLVYESRRYSRLRGHYSAVVQGG